MPEIKNYLLGYGERLTEALEPPRRPMDKRAPYTFSEARARLAPRVQSVARELLQLPRKACPHDEVVAGITLHPAYLAKSFFPTGLLQTVRLEAVGSKPLRMRPEKGAKPPNKRVAQPLSITAEIFVAGRRGDFRDWAASIRNWHERFEGAAELVRVEDIRAIEPDERIRPMRSRSDNPLLEVVLHRSDDYVLEGFRDYLKEMDVDVDLDDRIMVQGLCFLPVRVPTRLHNSMAQFSFLRVAREMPQLRQLRPMAWPRGLRSAPPFRVRFEKAEPLNPELRVGIFDGGVAKGIFPEGLVHRKVTNNLGDAVHECQEHGTGVTSAILYGSLSSGGSLPRPFAAVEHYRVIDKETAHDTQGHFFEVLNRIMNVLRQKRFDFVNLSLGPDLPIEDDEVHVWTASLDEHFSDGNTLVTVAAGNTGEDDWDSGNARIQAPADGVNILSVGASDTSSKNWSRAPYSSIGPGRSPGVVKPDVLAFGGSTKEPFWVPDLENSDRALPIQGTSFASPLALRTAIGIRAYLGSVVQPIALKALLIHHSEPREEEQREVGWGRIPTDPEQLILCPDGTVHVLYQGTLEPGKYLRARVPLPATGLHGTVGITATFCYATETDPQDPLNYTRAGLEIAFRPNKDKFTQTEDGPSKNPSTKAFFSSKRYANEDELRRDAHKWEPCLKASKNFRASSLHDPTFDIHYNARHRGANYLKAKPIPYALVLTVQATHLPDLYNKVALRYRTQLEPLRPVIEIPIRVS